MNRSRHEQTPRTARWSTCLLIGLACGLAIGLHGSGWANHKPTAKSVAKPTTTPPTATERAKAAARKATAAAGAAGAATAAALALADDNQKHAFTLTHLGEYECEFKRAVRVLAHPKHEGYVDLQFDKRVITARPVLSSTGAVRLEDVTGRYLMVQIAFKSMLMDTRLGQRVADECLHDAHHEAKRAAAQAPATPGLGISTPAQATATAEAPNAGASAPIPTR